MAAEPSSAKKAAFSISEFVLRNLKLSFGRSVLIVDLFFEVDGPGDSLLPVKTGLGQGEKITLLGDGVGVGLKKSSLASSCVLVCVSKILRFFLVPCCCPLGSSSVISGEARPYI